MKLALIIILAAVGLCVVLEVGLRSLFGFGNPLIYITDPQIGYLLAPNQRTRRYGNRIAINQYSMRSAPIEKIPAPSTLRVLIIGDSIANGGWWTDQDHTISSLLTRSLKSLNISNFQDIEVLNASANSWSPRNELAYLQRFGNFNAQVVVLLINTDDLFGTAPTSLPVGRDRNYPDKKPPLALAEVWQRYRIKPKPIPEIKAVQKETGDIVGINLEAISQIQALSRENNSEFLLLMTPLLREIGEPGPRDYEIKTRQRLIEFTQSQQITYIDFLPLLNAHPDAKALYQDHIHFNFQGNQFLSQVIERSLLAKLNAETR
ncbi:MULTISPECIES: SGNH/GDSL hydrolase family protein [unclassified Nodularia (in: cyanobacteria)]|uniref:GDSL-type esterase/lipase family protein n=1 Tax=unclassified Nodularia (in: cyanobacteria) TaxID=2656917 RepID=UPI00187DEC59|nr:SGNH/GDSL hydrolase family protein [Nodularia sp. LEGE 06071]MBE9200784.1 SGNH/GDSL hydrolase family protein [Nodularia sp. LEGE 06071]MCC2693834.1 SGNH/GDSL hydrolase family protein [Nodularia sp. LEGE 04288]